MIFIYPKELKKGDRLRIGEENRVWWEAVDSITVQDEPDGNDEKKVLVFTEARMIACDPGVKITVDRPFEESLLDPMAGMPIENKDK